MASPPEYSVKRKSDMERRFLLLILCLLLLLPGCGVTAEEPAAAAETPVPETTEIPKEIIPPDGDNFPVPENAVAAADGVRPVIGRDDEGNPLYGEALRAGQSIKVHTLGTRMCLIETADGMGTVPRWEVLLYGEKGYKTWKGYAAKGATVYSDWDLNNEIRQLKKKTQVTVLFGTESWLYAEIKGEYIFIDSRDVAAIKEPEPSPDTPEDWTPPMY